MGLTFNGTTQYVSSLSTVVDIPLTVAGWITLSSVATDFGCMGLCISTSNDAYLISFYTSDKHYRAEAIGTGDDDTAASSTVIAASAWHHVAAVYSTTTSRSCYVDGTAKVSSVVSNTGHAANVALTAFAGGLNMSALTTMPGSCASNACWNVVLTDTEIASLAAGCSPRRIRPANLFKYSRLCGAAPYVDMVSSTAWTAVAAPTAATTGPRLYGP